MAGSRCGASAPAGRLAPDIGHASDTAGSVHHPVLATLEGAGDFGKGKVCQMTCDDQKDSFDRFLAAFPPRDDGHDVDAARDAWERAIGRAHPETIIAGAVAYARSRESQPARYTMSTKRWLNEGRWRDLPRAATAPAPLFWVDAGSREWQAWTRFRGKSPPIDRRGGWRFPTRWPPTIQAAE